ncbi:MAG TPA: hypothetical protein VLA21_09350 [Candidatus Limnocylindria bacterium]|nr:hypothetical protein [Candidatus Limnocylindria bacterium]
MEHRITPSQYAETMKLLDRFLQCRIRGEELRRRDFEEGLARIFSQDEGNVHRFFHVLARIVVENKLWFASRAVFRRR